MIVETLEQFDGLKLLDLTFSKQPYNWVVDFLAKYAYLFRLNTHARELVDKVINICAH